MRSGGCADGCSASFRGTPIPVMQIKRPQPADPRSPGVSWLPQIPRRPLQASSTADRHTLKSAKAGRSGHWAWDAKVDR